LEVAAAFFFSRYALCSFLDSYAGGWHDNKKEGYARPTEPQFMAVAGKVILDKDMDRFQLKVE